QRPQRPVDELNAHRVRDLTKLDFSGSLGRVRFRYPLPRASTTLLHRAASGQQPDDTGGQKRPDPGAGSHQRAGIELGIRGEMSGYVSLGHRVPPTVVTGIGSGLARAALQLLARVGHVLL